MNALTSKAMMVHARALTLPAQIRLRMRGKKRVAREEGQGTVEYAILVGVLAVIAIIAIVAFKDKIQELWDAIKDGLEEL